MSDLETCLNGTNWREPKGLLWLFVPQNQIQESAGSIADCESWCITMLVLPTLLTTILVQSSPRTDYLPQSLCNFSTVVPMIGSPMYPLKKKMFVNCWKILSQAKQSTRTKQHLPWRSEGTCEQNCGAIVRDMQKVFQAECDKIIIS